VLNLIKSKALLTPIGLLQIVNIKASINTGLNDDLKKGFPDSLPFPPPRTTYTFSGLINPY
jgi:hypothetical protein